MDYFVILLVLQSLKDLNGKPPNQIFRYSLEVVILYELIEVD